MNALVRCFADHELAYPKEIIIPTSEYLWKFHSLCLLLKL